MCIYLIQYVQDYVDNWYYTVHANEDPVFFHSQKKNI